jgi:hypothetical protein
MEVVGADQRAEQPIIDGDIIDEGNSEIICQHRLS